MNWVIIGSSNGLAPAHRQFIMTSSNGNIFRITGPLCGEFIGQQWIPRTKASDAELWCFFDLPLNKQLSKQSWGWWSETPTRSFRCQCNVNMLKYQGINIHRADFIFIIFDRCDEKWLLFMRLYMGCNIYYEGKMTYRQTSNISNTLVGNKHVDHSDVFGAAPTGAAPTTSSFWT